MKYGRLLQPGTIGNLEIKNRIIKAPTLTRYASRDGEVTNRLLRFYKEAAKGGAGLVIVETSYIDTIGSRRAFCGLGIYDDFCVPGLTALADVIKQCGARAGMQINHHGRQALGPTILAPSRIPWEASLEETGIIPRELTTEEVMGIVQSFAEAAERAKIAGFDLVEIHGAHGYLITNFLSAHTNRRTDWYGGSLENRMRFPLEIVKAVKEKVGKDFPVGMRISAVEFNENGITLDESRTFARRLEEAGIDVIHVSASEHHVTDREIEPMYYAAGGKIYLAEAIKQVVKVPVIAAGSINTPVLAEDTLINEKADFISMARPLLADPYFVKKIEEGRPEDIVPCIRCMSCMSNYKIGVHCAVNVSLGRDEELLQIKPSSAIKKVAVIGGGPAGMEAARVAALMGHKVTIYEKQGKMGGLLKDISVPDFKRDIRALLAYYITQISKLGIAVIHEEATADTIVGSGFDGVILAAGSTPLIPEVQGVNRSSVMTGIDVLQGAETKEDVIVVGGGMTGCDVALYLAMQKKRVKLVEMTAGFAADADRGTRRAISGMLSEYDVELCPSLKLHSITEKGVLALDQDGKKREICGETVVLALGMDANNGLVSALKENNVRFQVVGDCVKPRKIYDAIYEAHLAARNLF